VRGLTSLPSEPYGAQPASHKHHLHTQNSRASPFLLSTYAPYGRHSNRYYIRNTLTSYHKCGTIHRELWPPARSCFPFWNSSPTCPSHPTSPRNSLRTLSLFVSPIFFPSALVCPQRRRLARHLFLHQAAVWYFLFFPFRLYAIDCRPLLPPFRNSSHQYHSKDFSLPLFSYSYELFCIAQNAISNCFFTFRTLCAKHPGWGYTLQSKFLSFRGSTTHYSLLLTTTHYSLLSPLQSALTKKPGEGSTPIQPPGAHTRPGVLPVTSQQSRNSDFEDYRQDQRPLGGLLINVPL
jgi:hypothetical protein